MASIYIRVCPVYAPYTIFTLLSRDAIKFYKGMTLEQSLMLTLKRVMYDLRFHVLFNSVSVISGLLEVAHERLWALEE